MEFAFPVRLSSFVTMEAANTEARVRCFHFQEAANVGRVALTDDRVSFLPEDKLRSMPTIHHPFHLNLLLYISHHNQLFPP